MQMEFIRRMPQPQELMRDYPVSPELKQRKADRDREIREILEGKDDRIAAANPFGAQSFTAKATGPDGRRADGKIANLAYTADKL